MIALRTFLAISLLQFGLCLIVQPEWKIYYDLRTNQTIDTIDTSNPRLQLYRQRTLRIGFGPIPCSCDGFTCGCCSGIDIQAANFNRRACMNFTYSPQDFAINMDMIMNEESVFSQTFSGKNPPPLCMPVPLPPVVPKVDFCMRFFNIHTQGYNIFSCVDFETRIERAPILILHFDCMKMGQDGISHYKPDEIEFSEDPQTSSGGQDDQQIEVYDEVVEDSVTVGSQSMENVEITTAQSNGNYSESYGTTVTVTESVV